MTASNLPQTDAWRWNHHSFRAMNTDIYFWLFSQTGKTILLDLQDMFVSFEKRLSRFNPRSELSALNRARKPAFKAGPILFEAVEIALWAAEATGGIYDPTILSQLEQAGYNRSFEKLNAPAPLHQVPGLELDDTSARPSWWPFQFRSITLNRARREIFKPEGLRLDLGGVGKGWSVDRAADRLQGVGPFLVNAGGDIFACQTPPGEAGWPIDVIHPLDPAKMMATLVLNHRALATSTIAKRRWRQNGRIMHHLIDPRTGRPAQTDALSVTVVSARTVLAEVFAKVALILGVERGLAFLEAQPDTEGLVFTAEAEIAPTAGLSPLLQTLEPAGFKR